MANAWFRMYSEFATDPKVQMLSEANQRRFIMLLCLRCSNDAVTLHDEEVAFQLRISSDEWLQSKAVFVAKGMLSEDNSPASWDKRQFVSDSSAERVARHRAAKKRPCNVTETPPDTDTESDTEDSVGNAIQDSRAAAKPAAGIEIDLKEPGGMKARHDCVKELAQREVLLSSLDKNLIAAVAEGVTGAYLGELADMYPGKPAAYLIRIAREKNAESPRALTTGPPGHARTPAKSRYQQGIENMNRLRVDDRGNVTYDNADALADARDTFGIRTIGGPGS